MSTPVTAKLRRGKGVGKSGVSKQGGPCPHECGPTNEVRDNDGTPPLEDLHPHRR